MMAFFTTVPGIITAVGGIIVVIVTGIFYGLGLWKGKKDNADDRLINILQKTVDEMEKKVNKQTTDIETLTKEVHELKRDNEKYIDIFKGRDERTDRFYSEGFETMKITHQIHDAVTTMAESIRITNESTNKLIALLEKSITKA